MEIKNTTKLPLEIIDTVSIIEQPIMVCLDNDGEMGHFTIKLVYEDRNGKNRLSHFTIQDKKDKFDRDDIATEFFNYIEKDIKDGFTRQMKIPFEVTEAHHNYIDNVIEETMKHYFIHEVE